MGLVKNNKALRWGDAISIGGIIPNGIATQGEVVYRNIQPAWQFLTSVEIPNIGASTPINTLDANIIIVSLSGYTLAATLSDSNNNIWTITPVAFADNADSSIGYCIRPKTSINHTFTIGGGLFDSAIVMVFNGPRLLNFNASTSTIFNPGTPSPVNITLPPINTTANSLSVTGIANSPDIVLSVDSGFTITDNFTSNSGITSASAYLISPTPATISPTWVCNNGESFPGIAASMISFSPAVKVPTWELLAATQVTGTGNTPAIDTRGANLLVMVVSTGPPTTGIGDNQGNAWTQGVIQNVATFSSRIYYVINPTTSATHTFNFLGQFAAIAVSAFVCSSVPVVSQSSTGSVGVGVLALQLGSIAPAPHSLVISGINNNQNISGIDSSFTVISILPISANYAVGSAYRVPDTSIVLAPTWSLVSNPSGAAATMLSFTPS